MLEIYKMDLLHQKRVCLVQEALLLWRISMRKHSSKNAQSNEGAVFASTTKDAEGERVLTVGAQHGYTTSDLSVNKDDAGNVTTENRVEDQE